MLSIKSGKRGKQPAWLFGKAAASVKSFSHTERPNEKTLIPHYNNISQRAISSFVSVSNACLPNQALFILQQHNI